MIRFWIAVASKEHVKRGVMGGFAQVCHGKAGLLNKMRTGDWVVYYSPTITFGGKDRCQAFTAIGQVLPGDAYEYEMSSHFKPWRRDVQFKPARDAAIHPLLERLEFITDLKKWGFPFRRGCFEIQKQDFDLIASEMGVVYEA